MRVTRLSGVCDGWLHATIYALYSARSHIGPSVGGLRCHATQALWRIFGYCSFGKRFGMDHIALLWLVTGKKKVTHMGIVSRPAKNIGTRSSEFLSHHIYRSPFPAPECGLLYSILLDVLLVGFSFMAGHNWNASCLVFRIFLSLGHDDSASGTGLVRRPRKSQDSSSIL